MELIAQYYKYNLSTTCGEAYMWQCVHSQCTHGWISLFSTWELNWWHIAVNKVGLTLSCIYCKFFRSLKDNQQSDLFPSPEGRRSMGKRGIAMMLHNAIAECYEMRLYKEDELLTTIYTYIPATTTTTTSEYII